MPVSYCTYISEGDPYPYYYREHIVFRHPVDIPVVKIGDMEKGDLTGNTIKDESF